MPLSLSFEEEKTGSGAVVRNQCPDSEVSELQALPPDTGGGDGESYLHGFRYWMVSFLNGIMLFVVQTEISIVTTSLVAITDDIGGFDMSSWIMSSYLLGYVAVVVIAGKLSDIFGRKPIFVSCIFIFTVFSGGCAAAKTMPQLIILRALQGVGGGGSYALSTIMIIDMVPPRMYSKQVAYTGIAIVLAMVLGPIIGGAISNNTSWRWIFLFNVPVGALGLALALAGIPRGFPHHARAVETAHSNKPLARLDLPGCLLLLLAAMSFTAAFQEADSRFAWDSAYVIALLVVSVALWVSLLVWERRVTLTNKVREAVLPWRLVTDRAMVGLLLGIVLLGGPLTVTVLQLPQRFQLINGLSDIDAGVRIVPFGGAVPVGTITCAIVGGKFGVPVVYIAIFGALLQVLGYALLSTLGASIQFPSPVYGYQVIVGFGCGINFQALLLAVPFTVGARDKAVGLGAAIQSRAMGSAVMVAVTTSVFNGYVLSRLSHLGIANPSSLTKGQSDQEPGMGAEIRDVLSEGYGRQMLVLCACGAAQVFSTLLMWKKNQIKIA